MQRSGAAGTAGDRSLFQMMTAWTCRVIELASITGSAPPEDISGDPRAADWSDMPRRAWCWMWTFPSNTQARRAAFLLGKAAFMLHRYATARGAEKSRAPLDPVRVALDELRSALDATREEIRVFGGYNNDRFGWRSPWEDRWIMYRTNKSLAEALDLAGPRTDLAEMVLASTPRDVMYVVSGADVSMFRDLILEMGVR